MTYKTRSHLNFIADVLEGTVKMLAESVREGLVLVGIDIVWGKSKYRKRRYTPRPIVHKTIIMRERAPRMYRVHDIDIRDL